MDENSSESGITPVNRDRVIVRTSIAGVITNILLAAFKAVIGLASNSIAVTLDAVNNLSDVLSSTITIIGTKMAGKSPDREHPLGHGRIEYLSAMIVSCIIFYAGVTAAVESVKKIIDPELPNYSITSLVIIAVAVLVKFVLGSYVKARGQQVNSQSLIASGTDALYDGFLSSSVLISAIIYTVYNISLEAYVGLLIALFIIKAGYGMITDTVNELLGIRADTKKIRQLREILTEDEKVKGAYDMVLFNYGPDKDFASVRIELPDTMSVLEAAKLCRKLEVKVFKRTGIIIASIGIYSYHTQSGEATTMLSDIRRRVLAHDWALQLHGFCVDLETREMQFDVVMSFDIDHNEGIRILREELCGAYPDYSIEISPDVDISVSDQS